jgi:hypothetical protein
MPFGGHQQTLKGPLRMVPFLHYLPRGLYARLLRRVEPDRPGLVQDLLATYDARISLARFRRLVKRHGMVIERSRLYLLNPAYQLKFGWPALPLPLPRALEFLGEVFATSMYAWVRRA